MRKNATTTPEDDEPKDAPAPADAVACGALGCRRAEDLERVRRADGETRTLCPSHRKSFLKVSS